MICEKLCNVRSGLDKDLGGGFFMLYFFFLGFCIFLGFIVLLTKSEKEFCRLLYLYSKIIILRTK